LSTPANSFVRHWENCKYRADQLGIVLQKDGAKGHARGCAMEKGQSSDCGAHVRLLPKKRPRSRSKRYSLPASDSRRVFGRDETGRRQFEDAHLSDAAGFG